MAAADIPAGAVAISRRSTELVPRRATSKAATAVSRADQLKTRQSMEKVMSKDQFRICDILHI